MKVPVLVIFLVAVPQSFAISMLVPFQYALVVGGFKLTRTQIRESVKLIITSWRSIWRILWDHKTVCAERFFCVASEDIPFYQDLVVGTGVDCLVVEVEVVIIVEMLVSEATGCGSELAHILDFFHPFSVAEIGRAWTLTISTSALVPPVVVMISNMQVSKIGTPQRITVSYKRGFPVIMEVIPR